MPQAVEVVGQAEQERLADLHRQATSRSAGEDLFSYTFAIVDTKGVTAPASQGVQRMRLDAAVPTMWPLPGILYKSKKKGLTEFAIRK